MNIYILPVSATFRDIKYPDPIIKSKVELEDNLKRKDFNLKINNKIGGDKGNEVYEGTIDKTNVVIKHTEHTLPRSPIEFLIMSDSFVVESKVLKKLLTTDNIKVPNVLHSFPKLTTYIMEDMRTEGYDNLASLILKKKLSKKSALKIGTALAQLAVNTRTWEEFKTNYSAQLNYYERSLEMLIAYPNNFDRYRKLESEYSLYFDDKEIKEGKNRFFVWPNSHPNNMLVNKDGDVAFIDFGKVHWGDQKYMVSSFVAHIALYSIAGYIPVSDAIEYIKDCIKAYSAVDTNIDEKIMVQYIAMELLHRANGKGIQGIKTSEDSLKIQKFARLLFDKEIVSIKEMLGNLKKLS